ncbi:NADP-dependent oxidoreductase domain-containing protein [Amylocarpus encephaloides]|uniref:NADP-dependent oxidoreductase domain-containing protein n=1 Tax=Amylocarpus encephaloides TaxID=45428 RepID=A0A9P7Y956_9HELO|nr:NADP-dependent oxidoreductase domain-containing protein [Amylocarpus encephaloides]
MSPPAQFPLRKLGRNGPLVPALGFGLMGLSAYYGDVDSVEERLKVLDRAYELGETFWDSADIYGDSEELIGKWFKKTGKRDDIFLGTKFGNIIDENWNVTVNSTKEHVRSAWEKSAGRLGVECVDLYYCHRVDGVTPIEETVGEMVRLKNERKIKYLGLSEVSAQTLRRACAVHHIDAVQMEYSPFCLDIEDPTIALLKTCRELGVATVAYSPLGRGFLTGSIRTRADFSPNDFRSFAPRFSKENFPKNLALVDSLTSIATRKNCTTGQLSLAWLLAQGKDVIPIPGTKKVKYLEENLRALDVVLSDEEVREIRGLLEGVEVCGTRYPEAYMGMVFGDTPELK